MSQSSLVTQAGIASFGRDLGSTATLPAVATDGSALRRGDVCIHTSFGFLFWNGTGWRQEAPLEITSTQRIALSTTGLWAGFQVYETDTTFLWQYAGSLGWLPLSPNAVAGKVWVTNGQSGAMTVNTEYAGIGMGGSRVSGGVTVANPQMTVPLDGLYDIAGSAYIMGGTGQVNAWLVRVRASVANLNIAVMGPQNKATTQDYQPEFYYQKMPLKAGDKLALSLYPYASGLYWYGINEAQGTGFAATWMAPLNGATPL